MVLGILNCRIGWGVYEAQVKAMFNVIDWLSCTITARTAFIRSLMSTITTQNKQHSSQSIRASLCGSFAVCITSQQKTDSLLHYFFGNAMSQSMSGLIFHRMRCTIPSIIIMMMTVLAAAADATNTRLDAIFPAPRKSHSPSNPTLAFQQPVRPLPNTAAISPSNRRDIKEPFAPFSFFQNGYNRIPAPYT